MSPMLWLAYVVLLLTSAAGVILVFFDFFGTFLIFAGAVVFAALTDFSVLDGVSLIVLGLLYLLGEGMEFLTVITGARSFGASKAGVAGAVSGGVAGAVIGAGFFGIGAIAGMFGGIVLGAFAAEFMARRGFRQSLQSGLGSVLGRAGSIAVKLAVAFCMIGFMIYQMVRAGGGPLFSA
mgnify:CR=1 FL=1